MFDVQFKMFLIRFQKNLENNGGIPMNSFLATFHDYYREEQRASVMKYLDELQDKELIDCKEVRPNFIMIFLTSKGHSNFGI